MKHLSWPLLARILLSCVYNSKISGSLPNVDPGRAGIPVGLRVAVFSIFGLSIMLISCDTNRVFESNTDFEGNFWAKDHLVSFEFEITDADLPYNIYTNIRNASAYSYHNLYYKYTLQDSTGVILAEKQQYVDLFDPKTGEPYGSGLGDLFDHQQLILENYEFASPGTYSLTFQHYMRKDTLPLILSIGARVEWASND